MVPKLVGNMMGGHKISLLYANSFLVFSTMSGIDVNLECFGLQWLGGCYKKRASGCFARNLLLSVYLGRRSIGLMNWMCPSTFHDHQQWCRQWGFRGFRKLPWNYLATENSNWTPHMDLDCFRWLNVICWDYTWHCMYSISASYSAVLHLAQHSGTNILTVLSI